MSRTNSEPREWGAVLSVREAAERLNVSPDTVRDLILRGELAAAKIGTVRGRRGGRYLVPEVAVREWLARAVRAESR